MVIDARREKKQRLKEALGIAEETQEEESKKETEEEESKEVELAEETKEEEKDKKKKKPRRKIFTKKNVVGKIKKIPEKVLTVKGLIFVSLIIAILAILQYQSVAMQSYVDRSSYPVEAAEWIKENLDVQTMKLFNDFNYGSYLLFQGIPVFIDGRADCYDPVFNGRSDDSFLAYMTASSLQTPYEDVVEKYGITHIITTYTSTLNTVLQKDENYESIYNDGTFVIYDTKPNKKAKSK